MLSCFAMEYLSFTQFAKALGIDRKMVYYLANKRTWTRKTKFHNVKPLKVKLIAGRKVIPASEITRFKELFPAP